MITHVFHIHQHDWLVKAYINSDDSDADLITISHGAHSRKGFALGAVLAAEYTKEHQGLLTISDMFKF